MQIKLIWNLLENLELQQHKHSKWFNKLIKKQSDGDLAQNIFELLMKTVIWEKKPSV